MANPAPQPNPADRFYAIDPLDSRYFDPEIAHYLSEHSRITYQAQVEAALAQTLADFHICTRTTANAIEKATKTVTAKGVYGDKDIERSDVKALINTIRKNTPDSAKPYVHLGAASYDVISTAVSLQLRTAIQELVIPRLQAILEVLLELTKTHAHTRQIGRTHGQHTVPITFGFALAEYVARLGESINKLDELSTALRGKFSGIVGAYNALNVIVDDPVKFEKALLARLGLQPALFSTQIYPPGPAIRLIDELAITAGIMANLANDMRQLERSEIAEVNERMPKGRDSLPTLMYHQHPRHFENIISLSKQVTSQIVNAHLNIISEHQRDLTDSASSRFYAVPVAIVAFMAPRLTNAMRALQVQEDNMRNNLTSGGSVVAAEPLHLLLEKYGAPAAYDKANAVAREALRLHMPLFEAIKRDKSIASYWRRFNESERRLLKNPEEYYIGLASQKAMTVYNRYKKMV